MRFGSRSLAAALVLFASGSASAVELNYKWKKGDVHRFQYEDDSTIEMKMPGGMGGMPGMGMQMPGMEMGKGGMNVRMKVQSVFSQKVLSVRKDGTAEVELTLEKMDLVGADKRVTTIDTIPPAAKKVKAEVDRKGNAKFFKMVTVYIQEGRTVVGVHNLKAGPKGASASMTAGDTRVDVVAAVDPKSGTVSLAMTEKKAPPPALKAVKIKEEDPSVDVLPKQIFDMMVLPDGDLAPGGRYEVATPMGAMALTLAEIENNMAQMRTTVAQKAEVPAEAAGESAAGQESGDAEEGGSAQAMGGMNMGGGMPGMGGMNMGGGMPGMGSGSGNDAGGAMGMKVDLDVNSGFDVAAGRLVRIEGTQVIDQSSGGMGGMKVSSRFSLQRL
ncbi:hypothetical protein BO221_46110 [Archangium sp. Cb G35]|uniref:hypothetical protein n=1 Tax=Archangium sp. Cb G35 TaxID=1920190 RepID=UPI000936D498|nr:hypothetical protein [Archangium sp. Cb G35]OJT17485.1 hypothetical protein BO221_46110 [Archangium sp. Cb G35]